MEAQKSNKHVNDYLRQLELNIRTIGMTADVSNNYGAGTASTNLKKKVEQKYYQP